MADPIFSLQKVKAQLGGDAYVWLSKFFLRANFDENDTLTGIVNPRTDEQVTIGGSVTNANQLTDMPSSLINKGGKILAVDSSELTYTQVDLINGFFNFKPENYLKTRAAFADMLLGTKNMQVAYMMDGSDRSFDPNYFNDFKYATPMLLARKLTQMGIKADAQNWMGQSSYSAWNTGVNATDFRISNLAPSWDTTSRQGPSFKGAYNITNTANPAPFLFRPMNSIGASYGAGQSVVTDTLDVFHADLAAGGNDTFTVRGGTIGAPLTVQAISKANPGVIQCNGHTCVVGDLVLLECTGMTQFKGNIFVFVNNVIDANNIQGRYTEVEFGGASIDTSAFGTFVAGTLKKVTFAASTVVSQVINGGVDVVRKSTFRSVGAQVWEIKKSAGNTNKFDLKGLSAYDSSVAQMNILKINFPTIMVYSSSTDRVNNPYGIMTHTNANSGIGGGTVTAAGKTPLVILEVFVGDGGTTQSVIEEKLNTLITALKASGSEVLLGISEAVPNAWTSTGNQNAARYAVYNAAIAQDVALFDIGTLRGSAQKSIDNGFIGSAINFSTPRGSADVANTISSFFTMLTQNNRVSALGETAPYVPIKVSILTGGTAKVILKEIMGNHDCTGMLADTGFKVGSIRPHSPKAFWSGVETGEDVNGNPIYDWSHLDEWVLGADAIGATIMYTFSSTPRHAVRQDWYNGITAIQRNTAYNTLGTLARPFTGNNCLYVLTKVGTTGAVEPATYPMTNAAGENDYPYNMIQVRPGDGTNSQYLVGNAGLSVAAGIYQPPGQDSQGRWCRNTVADGTTVWQLAGDPWNAATNAFPADPVKAQRFATAVASRFNAVSPVNPTGKILIKFFELGSNEPNVKNTIADGLTAYAQSKQFSIVTGTQLVDMCEAEGNGVRSVNTNVELQSPGFTQYGSIGAGSVNAFMQASNTAGTLKGYDTCDVMNFHPYGGLYSPTWSGDLIDSVYFGIKAAQTYISQLPAGNNPRGIPYRNMKVNISEWGIIAENIAPGYNGADTNMIAMRNWMANPNPAVRYVDKMIVKLIAASQGMTGFYEFKWDMASTGNMQLGTVNGWPADPNGARKANNDMYAFIGQTITEAYRYIDGTGRFEFKINGVTYIYGRP